MAKTTKTGGTFKYLIVKHRGRYRFKGARTGLLSRRSWGSPRDVRDAVESMCAEVYSMRAKEVKCAAKPPQRPVGFRKIKRPAKPGKR